MKIFLNLTNLSRTIPALLNFKVRTKLPYIVQHYNRYLYKTEDCRVMEQDIVTYVVPFGIFLRIINTLLIEKKVNEILKQKKSSDLIWGMWLKK